MTSTQCSLDLGVKIITRNFGLPFQEQSLEKADRDLLRKENSLERIHLKNKGLRTKNSNVLSKTTSYQSDKALRVKIFAYREIPKSTTKN